MEKVLKPFSQVLLLFQSLVAEPFQVTVLILVLILKCIKVSLVDKHHHI